MGACFVLRLALHGLIQATLATAYLPRTSSQSPMISLNCSVCVSHLKAATTSPTSGLSFASVLRLELKSPRPLMPWLAPTPRKLNLRVADILGQASICLRFVKRHRALSRRTAGAGGTKSGYFSSPVSGVPALLLIALRGLRIKILSV